MRNKIFQPDNPEIYKIFHKAVTRLRAKRNITQAEMAKRLYISVPTYNRYESGDLKVKADMLYKIAEVLDVPVEALVTKDESDKLTPKEMYIISKMRLLDDRGLEAVENCIEHEYKKHGRK